MTTATATDLNTMPSRTRDEIESLYAARDARVIELLTKPGKITLRDFSLLDRGGRCGVMSARDGNDHARTPQQDRDACAAAWRKLEHAAQRAALHDSHAHVRSCALIAQRAASHHA